MPKHVVSSTLAEPLEWNNSTVLKGDVPTAVPELKQQDRGPILVAGSATLAWSLIENDPPTNGLDGTQNHTLMRLVSEHGTGLEVALAEGGCACGVGELVADGVVCDEFLAASAA